MTDIICYISDLQKFKAEAIEKAKDKMPGFWVTESGQLEYNVAKTQVVYNGNESVCLLRLNQHELDIFNSLLSAVKIGICRKAAVGHEYVFEPGGKEIYERIYDTTPRDIALADGSKIKYQPPYKIGVFA